MEKDTGYSIDSAFRVQTDSFLLSSWLTLTKLCHPIWRAQLGAVPGKFLSIVSQDPSDSKPNRLHVDIFRFCFHSFEVCSIDSSKMMGKFPEVFNFQPVHL